MALTDTGTIEARINGWREPERAWSTPTPPARRVHRRRVWSEADALGAEAETWLSGQASGSHADLRTRPGRTHDGRTNNWREPLDEVGRPVPA
ncbi:MAG: hypothetical protein U5R31_08075 [Acidimicrobiia bacterium]|nr:hypothetical protein [Acidimicrobiia bacterium]